MGTFSAEDGFRKTFNLWEDIDSIRASGKTPNDRHIQPPEQDIAYHEDKMHDGETVAEGAVSSTIVSVMEGQR